MQLLQLNHRQEHRAWNDSVGGAVVASATAGDQSVRFSVPDTATEVRIVFTPDAETPGSAVLKKLASMRGFVLTYW